MCENLSYKIGQLIANVLKIPLNSERLFVGDFQLQVCTTKVVEAS